MSMTGDHHFYEPRLGHGLTHDPFNAIVGPRPIGWMSTTSVDGVLNLAPYSFFNAFNYVPPLIGFASLGYKDSVANIEATGAFCWNLVSRDLAEAMNATCAPVSPEVNEFELAGLDPRASRTIDVPHVAQAKVAFECRLADLHQLRAADGTMLETWLTIGEVTGIHIDRALLSGGSYDTAAAEPVLRGGGPTDYFAIGDDSRFHMRRPEATD